MPAGGKKKEKEGREFSGAFFFLLVSSLCADIFRLSREACVSDSKRNSCWPGKRAKKTRLQSGVFLTLSLLFLFFPQLSDSHVSLDNWIKNVCNSTEWFLFWCRQVQGKRDNGVFDIGSSAMLRAVERKQATPAKMDAWYVHMGDVLALAAGSRLPQRGMPRAFQSSTNGQQGRTRPPGYLPPGARQKFRKHQIAFCIDHHLAKTAIWPLNRAKPAD